MGSEKLQEVKAWLAKAGNDLRGVEVDLAAEPPLIEDALFHWSTGNGESHEGFSDRARHSLPQDA